ncbi:arginine repressor [Clostridium sp.]|uniref:arginine repressor n=1 Tax=Clostridium sp. TaxID=1506 RepID=UPI002FC9BC34
MENELKKRRREAIINIIQSEDIGKQEELVFKLKHLGINVTQSTLSRDLKEMHIIRKSLENKQSKYILATEDNVAKKFKTIFEDAVISIFIQEYFISIRTLKGMAAVVGELIDRLDDKRIRGTVAKNNNVLILCANCEACKQVFKGLNDLRI